MYCKKCGKQVLAGGRFCGSCGEAVSNQPVVVNQPQNEAPTTSNTPPAAPSYVNPTKPQKSSFTVLIVLSIILLLNVIFVPMFSVWGGLFARWADQSFMTALGTLGLNHGYWHDIFVWSALVPGVILFISCLARGKVMAILSSLGGAGLLLLNLIIHVGQVGFYAISPEDGNIAIGFWIALILFVICFFCSIAIKKNVVAGNIYAPTLQQSTTSVSEVPGRKMLKVVGVLMVILGGFSAIGGIVSLLTINDTVTAWARLGVNISATALTVSVLIGFISALFLLFAGITAIKNCADIEKAKTLKTYGIIAIVIAVISSIISFSVTGVGTSGGEALFGAAIGLALNLFLPFLYLIGANKNKTVRR